MFLSNHHMKPSAILLFEALPSNLSISHQTLGSSKGSSGGTGAGGLAPVELEDADPELELGLGCLAGCFDGGGCSGSLLYRSSSRFSMSLFTVVKGTSLKLSQSR